jgi:hypothetical protein
MLTQQAETILESNVIIVTATTRARVIESKLSASVQKLSLRSDLEQLLSNAEIGDEHTSSVDDAPHCQDGVCMVTWKPQRPAA